MHSGFFVVQGLGFGVWGLGVTADEAAHLDEGLGFGVWGLGVTADEAAHLDESSLKETREREAKAKKGCEVRVWGLAFRV
jgi:hypothetical protein